MKAAQEIEFTDLFTIKDPIKDIQDDLKDLRRELDAHARSMETHKLLSLEILKELREFRKEVKGSE